MSGLVDEGIDEGMVAPTVVTDCGGTEAAVDTGTDAVGIEAMVEVDADREEPSHAARHITNAKPRTRVGLRRVSDTAPPKPTSTPQVPTDSRCAGGAI